MNEDVAGDLASGALETVLAGRSIRYASRAASNCCVVDETTL